HPLDIRSIDTHAGEQVDIFDHYWQQIRRHLFLILVLFFTVELVTLFVLLMATPLYTSSSTIRIEPQMPEVLERNAARDDEEGPSFFSTEWQILQSRTLAAKVIRALDLGNDPAFIGSPEKPGITTRVFSWIGSLLSSAHSHSNKSGRDEDILGIKSDLIDEYF